MVRALILTMGVLAGGGVAADTLAMPSRATTHAASAAVPAKLPKRGATMAQVQARFGAPSRRHAPAGGDAPDHPPITRWDYPGFSVFFERNLVLDTVVPGHFPAIHHRSQLSSGQPG